MVKKSTSRKRRDPLLLSRAVLEKKLEQLQLAEMTLKDVKKLEKMGFLVSNRAFLKNNTSNNKVFMRRRLKAKIRNNPNNQMLRDAQLKRVQHPNRNIKTYIIVTKTKKNGR